MKPVLKQSVRPGLLLAGVLIAFYALLLAVNKAWFFDRMFNMTFLAIGMGIAILPTAKYGRSVEGGLSFIDAFMMLFMIVIIGTGLYYLFEVLLYNVFAPALPEYAELYYLGDLESRYAEGSIDEAAYQQMLPYFKEIDTSYTPKWVFLRAVYNLMFWAVGLLIVAFFVSKHTKKR